MPITLFNRRYKHFRRYRQIVEVFLRHGFGYLVEQLDLHHLIPLRRRVLPLNGAPAGGTRAVRIRKALEELGPTFVKLGQVLSTRPDLVPRDIIDELERLQDHVPSVGFQKIAREVEKATGGALGEIFRAFDPQPLAAASIGQVHRAVLPGGQEVVVKVRRPGIEDVIGTDLDILHSLAALAEDRLKPELFSPRDLVEEFARILRQEMDFRIEAKNVERFRANFAREEKIRIPRVYWELTSERMLTMEYIHGVKVSDIGALQAMGVDPARVARRGARAFLKQVLIDGFFHGDPHPGNIFVLPDESIAFLDFGIVGRIDENTLIAVADLFIGIIQRDVDRVVRGMTSIGILRDEVNLRALKADMLLLIDRHHGKSLREIEIGTIVHDSLELTYKHRILMPTDFMLLAKALLTVEGLGKALDPDFNAVEIAEPFARELIRRRWHPARLSRQTAREVSDYVQVLAGLPSKVDRLVSAANRGELAIRFRHEGLENLIHRLDLVSNRISAAVVIAAVVVGSSLIIQTNKGPLFLEFPVVGILGFLLAGILGILLVLSILRSGRF